MGRRPAPAPRRVGRRIRAPLLRTPVLPIRERRPHQPGPVPAGARRPTRWCPTTSGRSLPGKNGREDRPRPAGFRGGRVGRAGSRDPGDARTCFPDPGERPGPGTVAGRPAVRSRRGSARLAARASPVVVLPDPPRMPPRVPVPLSSRGRTPAGVPGAFPRPYGGRVQGAGPMYVNLLREGGSGSLRQAIVLTEVFGAPVALRSPGREGGGLPGA